MDKNRKLIISDLDGTLLNNKSELSNFTIKAVKKIIDAGHIFCISTGRPLRSAIKFYNQLGLNTIISTLNGGALENPSDKNFDDIYFSFDKNVLLNILKNKEVINYTNYIVIENTSCTYFICQNEEIKVNKKLLNRFHIEKDLLLHIKNPNKINWEDEKLKPVSILLSLKKEHIDKVSFSIKTLLDTFIIRMWNIENDDNVVIELNALFSTKGNSMKYLSCYYGISLSNTYAFGDGENDIEMIKSSRNAYAMKNALPSVKLFSYKITDFNNDQDGVAKQILKELKI